jgi:hypothetical protein
MPVYFMDRRRTAFGIWQDWLAGAAALGDRVPLPLDSLPAPDGKC